MPTKLKFIMCGAGLILAGLSVPGHASFSLGIPGVVSVGDGGVKVGPKANGTHVELPKCGGAICDGLEHAKNEVTGENQRKAAQKEAEKAAQELTQVNAELTQINGEIDKLIHESKDEQMKFVQYKTNVIDGLRRFQAQLNVVELNKKLVDSTLLEVRSKLHSILKVSQDIVTQSVLSGQALATTALKLGPEDAEALKVNEALVLIKTEIPQSEPLAQAIGALQEGISLLRDSVEADGNLFFSLSRDSLNQAFFDQLTKLDGDLVLDREDLDSIFTDVAQSNQITSTIIQQTSTTN